MKRLRLFAGPNGSGKSTLFNQLKSSQSIHTDIYINADRFEKLLKEKGEFNFNAYRISVSQQDFSKHILASSLLSKIGGESILDSITIESGILRSKLQTNQLNSYLASFISAYLSQRLIETGQSFSFETVMSHNSKLKLIELAKKEKYKTYLYFIATKSFELNIERVALRVKQGGHNVDKTKIKERFDRSLRLLQPAIQLCDRSYVIDNTNEFELILEIENGKKIKYQAAKIPEWVSQNLQLV